MSQINEKSPKSLKSSVKLINILITKETDINFINNYRVVIGAPKGDTSALQPGVTKGGAVFRCEILDDDRCYMIPFDSKGKLALWFTIITYLHNGVRN